MKHNFKNLEIWKRSRTFVTDVYTVSKRFPNEEQFGLTSQIRRAAVSVPSNIAEGCGRGSNAQFMHFLDIAIGSNCEVETQLYLSFDMGYITKQEMERLTEEAIQIRRMIMGFKNRQSS